MNPLRSGTRLRLIGLAAVLLIVMLGGVACAPPAPSAPTPTAALAAPAATTAVTAAPVATQPTAIRPAGSKTSLLSGVDADGNFYRGDPKAPVKLVEYSDFQ